MNGPIWIDPRYADWGKGGEKMTKDGAYVYSSEAGSPGAESQSARTERERFWRSLGKKIRKGARIY